MAEARAQCASIGRRIESMLKELRDQVERAGTVPEIVAERCVHAHAPSASCRACVEICPRAAWQLGDDALGLDTAACDGCGLCAAACPEGALLHEHEPALRETPAHLVAFGACERTDLPAGEGVMPCVHALGVRDLLRLHRQGVRELIVARADCPSCPRGPADRLADLLAPLNRALDSHGLPRLELRHQSAPAWLEARTAGSTTPNKGPSVSRRAFFRRAAVTTAVETARLAGVTAEERGRFEAPGALLVRRAAAGALPAVPVIDEARCNGCDACVRLCPHGALGHEEGDEGPAYEIDATSCSGCNLCVDVCDQGAVTIARWAPQSQTRIALAAARCPACGVPFHQPAARPTPDGLCRICRQTNHARQLFQVLD